MAVGGISDTFNFPIYHDLSKYISNAEKIEDNVISVLDLGIEDEKDEKKNMKFVISSQKFSSERFMNSNHRRIFKWYFLTLQIQFTYS